MEKKLMTINVISKKGDIETYSRSDYPNLEIKTSNHYTYINSSPGVEIRHYKNDEIENIDINWDATKKEKITNEKGI